VPLKACVPFVFIFLFGFAGVKIHKLIHIALILVPFLMGCNLARHVPEGQYLLKKNEIEVVGAKFDKDQLNDALRIRSNNTYLGLKIRLALFNAVDSAKVAGKRIKKNLKLRDKNAKIRAKERRINEKRIAQALEKNKTTYRRKTLPRKDTLEPNRFFREWLKYGIGEPPVILDTSLVRRSEEQLDLFLKKRGYYYSTIRSTIRFNKRKAIVNYQIESGTPYRIDSIYFLNPDNEINRIIGNYLKKKDALPKKALFDSDVLDDLRNSIAREMRDNTYYGFTANHLFYVVDTNRTNMKLSLGIGVKNKSVRVSPDSDSTIAMRHMKYKIGDVFFHLADTSYFKGNFAARMDSLGIPLTRDYFVQTLDTFLYQPTKIRNAANRKATFLYNSKLPIKPEILEMRNYLEHDHWYRGYYLERSYSQILDMDVFQAIKPVLTERQGTNLLDVHYYLVPAKYQNFTFEPRATNSNGYLGVSASVNYLHKNLFRGGERLTLSFSGGFESQPPIFDEDITGQKIQTAARSFNTFEIGPTAKLELPGLRPFGPTMFAKRQSTKSEFALAYNYQSRLDFKRNLFQFSYKWKWLTGKTQAFQMGIPFLTSVKYVQIRKSDFFEERLAELNDLFLMNAYSNQFIYHDFRLMYNWSNLRLEKSKHILSYNASFDVVGNLMQWMNGDKTPNELGQREVFGVPYSQFVRLDNELKLYQHISRKKSLNYRLQFGAGLPYGNSPTSLPFDYSFFAGGTNDNRGWRARELGPGAYKYYLDTNRTATQIGDIRLGASAEYRFNLGSGSLFKGAVFMDAGNVWSLREDINRPGGQFTSEWYNQIAIAGGVGLRLDMSFLIIRADIGIPLRNPALPRGARWIMNSRDLFYEELLEYFGPNYEQNYTIAKPFTPRFHIAIGYPF
jgi:outer membrane protein insertion porin family